MCAARVYLKIQTGQRRGSEHVSCVSRGERRCSGATCDLSGLQISREKIIARHYSDKLRLSKLTRLNPRIPTGAPVPPRWNELP